MAKKNVHVVPNPKGWAIQPEKSKRAAAIVDTQLEAIKIARQMAINQKSELVIHGTNGQIREKNSYGTDNCPPKG